MEVKPEAIHVGEKSATCTIDFADWLIHITVHIPVDPIGFNLLRGTILSARFPLQLRAVQAVPVNNRFALLEYDFE